MATLLIPGVGLVPDDSALLIPGAGIVQSGATVVTLVAATGTFTLSGTVAGLTAQRKLTVEAVSLAITGNDAAQHGRTLTAISTTERGVEPGRRALARASTVQARERDRRRVACQVEDVRERIAGEGAERGNACCAELVRELLGETLSRGLRRPLGRSPLRALLHPTNTLATANALGASRLLPLLFRC